MSFLLFVLLWTPRLDLSLYVILESSLSLTRSKTWDLTPYVFPLHILSCTNSVNHFNSYLTPNHITYKHRLKDQNYGHEINIYSFSHENPLQLFVNPHFPELKTLYESSQSLFTHVSLVFTYCFVYPTFTNVDHVDPLSLFPQEILVGHWEDFWTLIYFYFLWFFSRVSEWKVVISHMSRVLGVCHTVYRVLTVNETLLGLEVFGLFSGVL